MTLLAKREASYSARSGECFMPKRKRRRFIARQSGENEVDEAALRAMKHFAAAPQNMKRFCRLHATGVASVQQPAAKPCGFIRHFWVQKWRREGDSNPRQGYPCDGLANRSFRPLRHLSAIELSAYKHTPTGRNCQVQKARVLQKKRRPSRTPCENAVCGHLVRRMPNASVISMYFAWSSRCR